MANDEGVHLGRIGRAILAGVEGFVGGVATEEACLGAGGDVLERQAKSAVDPIVAATPKRGAVLLRTEADEPLGRLIDYTIRWFLHSPRDEAEARALGLLLVREVLRTAAALVGPGTSRPEELTRLLVNVKKGFHLAPRIENLAAIIGRSVAR